MQKSATESAIDVAYWFFNEAENAGTYLEDEKLHHLLFLAQLNYLSQNKDELLIPSLFICNKNGFSEPNLLKIFANGRPFMAMPKFSTKVSGFLKEIWKQYGNVPLQELSTTIKNSALYADNYIKDAKSVVQIDSMFENFDINSNILKNTGTLGVNHKKVMLSQNGPVIVSQWQPRKVNQQSTKGD